MMRIKRIKLDRGVTAMVLGTALIVSALVLLVHNIKQDKRAGDLSQRVLAQVFAVISDQQVTGGLPDLPAKGGKPDSGLSSEPAVKYDPKAKTAADLPVVKIDGYSYIGFLCIPALDLDLPVTSSPDQEGLKIAPCRHFGSARTGDLVIAGHNYKSHFGRIHTLELGDLIVFTDLHGVSVNFCVGAMEVVAATAVDGIKDSDWDLILYTCTYGGQQRLVVSCKITG